MRIITFLIIQGLILILLFSLLYELRNSFKFIGKLLDLLNSTECKFNHHTFKINRSENIYKCIYCNKIVKSFAIPSIKDSSIID